MLDPVGLFVFGVFGRMVVSGHWALPVSSRGVAETQGDPRELV